LQRRDFFTNFAGIETVDQIEQAIERLAPGDFVRLAAWMAERHHDEWARQMNQDAESGKLDFLFSEAAVERQAGTLRMQQGMRF
jgi:hypothetical protein